MKIAKLQRGEEALKTIARYLLETVRRNVAICYMGRNGSRAKIRVMFRLILRKYGYPLDKQEKATLTVLEQAELLCHDWAA